MLNPDQAKAVETAMNWWNMYKSNKTTKNIFELSGGAGVGKSYTASSIIRAMGLEVSDCAYITFTGKACLCLRLNGLPAQTIHSLIYDVRKIPVKDDQGRIQYFKGSPIMKTIFVKKDKLPSWIKVLILDEAGMVGKAMGEDIASFGLPIIALGDLKQLPPVIGAQYFLKKPDAILNIVMRQKEGSAIIYLAKLATHGIDIPYGEYGDLRDGKVITWEDLTDEEIIKYDCVVCEKNRTRDLINDRIRNILKRERKLEMGDKIVCVQNNWDIKLESDENIALVNGLVGYIDDMYKDTRGNSSMEIDFRPEFCSGQDKFFRVPINPNYPLMPHAERSTTMTQFLPGIAFEFGYALTCHKTQGSTIPNVLVVNEVSNRSDYGRKWLYTAITRASERVTIVQ